jgi:hypothetical protein
MITSKGFIQMLYHQNLVMLLFLCNLECCFAAGDHVMSIKSQDVGNLYCQ